MLFGSIERSHRRKHSDNKDSKGSSGISARSRDAWDSRMKRHQTIASEASEKDSSRGFARLPDGGNKGQTLISASDVELEDTHVEDGIQVRTDVYVNGNNRN